MGDAIKQLSDHIEAIRAEADAAGFERGVDAGYQKAMREIMEFAAFRGANPESEMPPPPPLERKPGVLINGEPIRQPRGLNRRRVVEVMTAARKPLGATQIQRALSDQGTPLAYSSIRHALGQLAEAGEARDVGGGVFVLLTETASPETKEAALI